MPDKKIAFPLVVEPFQEDFTGQLSWANLGNLVLRASSLHAEAHGFGYTYMQTHRRGWVLARLILQLERLPRTAEHYDIATWVSRIYNQFTDRLYAFHDAAGQPIGYGSSVWALIDYDTRRPVALDALPDGGFSHALLEESVPIAGPSRGRCTATEPVLEHRVVVSDLDINGHFNSIRYLLLALDSFDKTFHETHRTARVEINFGLEAYADDHLLVFRDDLGEGRYAINIVRRHPTADTADAVVARCLLSFEENGGE